MSAVIVFPAPGLGCGSAGNVEAAHTPGLVASERQSSLWGDR